MLPTNQKAPVVKVYSNVNKDSFVLRAFSEVNDDYKEYNHLYILSDDEIQKNDWFIHDNSPGLKQWKSVYKCHGIVKNNPGHLLQITPNGGGFVVSGIKTTYKIIASTDPTLNLPSPSLEFIQVFCKKQPKEIMVKYIQNLSSDTNNFDGIISLVVSNNQIFIRKIKQSYTREEVTEIIHKVIQDSEIGNHKSAKQYL